MYKHVFSSSQLCVLCAYILNCKRKGRLYMRDYLSYGIAVFVVCERFTFCILCGRNAFHCAQLFLCSLLLLCSTCKSTLTKGCHIFTCIIESHWLLTDGQAFLSKLEIFEFSCFGWSPAVCHVITEIPMLDFFLGGDFSFPAYCIVAPLLLNADTCLFM